jgi:hypothetical protein
VVISYRIWQDLYGGDPAVIGKPLRFAEIATSVIGVAPRDFDTPHGADFWVLMPLDPQGVNHSFEGFMRVKPGTTIERACSEMEGVMSNGWGIPSETVPAPDRKLGRGARLISRRGRRRGSQVGARR